MAAKYKPKNVQRVGVIFKPKRPALTGIFMVEMLLLLIGLAIYSHRFSIYC